MKIKPVIIVLKVAASLPERRQARALRRIRHREAVAGSTDLVQTVIHETRVSVRREPG